MYKFIMASVILLLITSTNTYGQMDLQGFQDLPWGVGPKEIKIKFAESIHEVPSRIQYKGLYVDLIIPDYDVSEVNFEVRFQMDMKTDKLAQVLLTYEDLNNTYSSLQISFDSLEKVLTRKYGEPTYRKDKKSSWFLASINLNRSWVTPTTTIDLSYSYTKGIMNHLTIIYFPTKGKDTNKI